MLFTEKLYEQYRREMRYHSASFPMTETLFCDWVTNEAMKHRLIQIENDGILLYTVRDTEDAIYCSIPVFGYYAANEKTLSMLFERLAKNMVNEKTAVFSVHLYAHDEASIRLFSMLQFGIISEKGIRQAEDNVYENKYIRELPKDELDLRWNDVWKLTEAIINHLKESPVFYPGHEFTEKLYREFYMDKNTRVFGAFAEDGTMLGIIESNDEQNEFVFGKVKSVNIGEAYVLPEYRACGLAKQLMLFAETHSAASRSWLEHGTANPNARGFWGKYYSTYEYTVIREIRGVK